MDELIDILTPEGKFTGKTALKSEAHQNGWFHGTVHVWLYTTDHKILLQQRGFSKKVFPGLWDISVAGHIGAGESVLDAAKREVSEELGLIVSENELLKIGTRVHQIKHKNGIQDNEYHHVFICKLRTSIKNLVIQEEEVEAIQLFDLTTLKNTKNLENILVSRFHDYYCNVYEKIENRLKTKD